MDRCVSVITGPEATPYILPEVIHNCGTTACLLGWAPVAGIRALKKESWRGYSARCFDEYFTFTWNFCFDPGWEDHPGKGAKRIAWILQGKDDFDACDGRNKEIEKFRPNWKWIEELAQ